MYVYHQHVHDGWSQTHCCLHLFQTPCRYTNQQSPTRWCSVSFPSRACLLMFNLVLSGMLYSNSFSGQPKPNYNKHFPRSFLLNYGRALENLPDDKILAKLKDWNCEWLARPNIAMSEMAGTLKDDMDTLQRYKGTVFTHAFVEELQGSSHPWWGPCNASTTQIARRTSPLPRTTSLMSWKPCLWPSMPWP